MRWITLYALDNTFTLNNIFTKHVIQCEKVLNARRTFFAHARPWGAPLLPPCCTLLNTTFLPSFYPLYALLQPNFSSPFAPLYLGLLLEPSACSDCPFLPLSNAQNVLSNAKTCYSKRKRVIQRKHALSNAKIFIQRENV